MMRKTLPLLLLAASFSLLSLACTTQDDDLDMQLTPADEPIVVDAVELAARLAEDPTTRVIIDLQHCGDAGYVLDQSEAPMPFEALLWSDGFTPEPVDFLTITAARGIDDLDAPVLSIRPYVDTEGFRQACGTFPEEQSDLHCQEDEWGWVCCSRP